MQRVMLKSKIHRATVTDANIDYEGSVAIDEALMEAAGIYEFEQVQIYDIANGNRLTTYAIKGERGSGVISASTALSVVSFSTSSCGLLAALPPAFVFARVLS